MSHYQKGRRAEIRAKKELEKAGFVVTRAAGSKGVADLVATKVLYVQVKAVKEPRGWTSEIEEMKDGLPSGPGIVKQLWVWPDGGPWEKYEVSETEV